MYFTEDVPYAAYLGKPICLIPIDSISYVRRVVVDVPDSPTKRSNFTYREDKKLYQFEIFLSS
jgi:hypothetical protein